MWPQRKLFFFVRKKKKKSNYFGLSEENCSSPGCDRVSLPVKDARSRKKGSTDGRQMSERADETERKEKRREKGTASAVCCSVNLLCAAKSNKWRSENWSNQLVFKPRGLEHNLKFRCVWFLRTLAGNRSLSTLFSLILKPVFNHLNQEIGDANQASMKWLLLFDDVIFAWPFSCWLQMTPSPPAATLCELAPHLCTTVEVGNKHFVANC